MQSPWILALVIILFSEGLMIGISPETWQRTMRQLAELPPRTLRRVGLAMSTAAVILMLLIYWSRP